MAPGWWILGIAVLSALIFLGLRYYQFRQQRRPIRYAQRHLEHLHQALKAGQLQPLDYVHQVNRTLKRLLVRGLGQTELGALSGQAWLKALDALTDDHFFTTGAGQILGDSRFQAQPEFNLQGFQKGIGRLVNNVHARRGQAPAGKPWHTPQPEPGP